jgi:drug/metabolite transporter (DMT)-like permease
MVAIVTLSEPIGSSVLAYLLLHEAVPVTTLLGGALVLTGIVLASRAEAAGGRNNVDR